MRKILHRLVIRVDRLVTESELKKFKKLLDLFKGPGDMFSVNPPVDVVGASSGHTAITRDEATGDIAAHTADDAPAPPSRPVIVRGGRHRPWRQRVEEAFALARQSYPSYDKETGLLLDILAWLECPPTEFDWSERPLKELKSIMDAKDSVGAARVVACVLRALGRTPSPNAETFVLPPRRDEWLQHKEREDAENRKANKALTGDEHIGFRGGLPSQGMSVPKETLRALLSRLDWKGKRSPMYIRDLFKKAGVPFTRGNAICFGKMARDYGGFDIADRTRFGVLYMIPEFIDPTSPNPGSR